MPKTHEQEFLALLLDNLHEELRCGGTRSKNAKADAKQRFVAIESR